MPYTAWHLPINLLRRLARRPRRFQVTTWDLAMTRPRRGRVISVVIADRSRRGRGPRRRAATLESSGWPARPLRITRGKHGRTPGLLWTTTIRPELRARPKAYK